MTPDQLFIVAILVPVIADLFLFGSGAAVLIFNYISQQERRRQDLEDRRTTAQALTNIHETVKEVGIKADASYKEANNANIKIQAVNDALSTALDLPQKNITNTRTNDPE